MVESLVPLAFPWSLTWIFSTPKLSQLFVPQAVEWYATCNEWFSMVSGFQVFSADVLETEASGLCWLAG